MSAAKEPPPDQVFADVQTFGVTCEVIDARGRRGCVAPVVVHAGVAYAFALLEGATGEVPAPVLIEALLDTDDDTSGGGGGGTSSGGGGADSAGTAEGDGWVALTKLGVLASLTAPELQVSCWQVPGPVHDVRLAAPWRTTAEIHTTLPQTPRVVPSPTGDGAAGFWGPALRQGRDLACFFVFPTTPPTVSSTKSTALAAHIVASPSARSPAPAVPQLQKRIGEQWYPLSFVQGVGGTSDDGVRVQLGHWALETGSDVDDLRLVTNGVI